MSNTYAHDIQAQAGVIEARDLRSTDVIMIRSEGQLERTPHVVKAVSFVNVSDVHVRFTDGTDHVFSPRMPVGLA